MQLYFDFGSRLKTDLHSFDRRKSSAVERFFTASHYSYFFHDLIYSFDAHYHSLKDSAGFFLCLPPGKCHTCNLLIFQQVTMINCNALYDLRFIYLPGSHYCQVIPVIF